MGVLDKDAKDELLGLKCFDISLPLGGRMTVLLMHRRGLVTDVARPVGGKTCAAGTSIRGGGCRYARCCAAHLEPRIVGVQEDAAVGKLDHRRRIVPSLT